MRNVGTVTAMACGTGEQGLDEAAVAILRDENVFAAAVDACWGNEKGFSAGAMATFSEGDFISMAAMATFSEGDVNMAADESFARGQRANAAAEEGGTNGKSLRTRRCLGRTSTKTAALVDRMRTLLFATNPFPPRAQSDPC